MTPDVGTLWHVPLVGQVGPEHPILSRVLRVYQGPGGLALVEVANINGQPVPRSVPAWDFAARAQPFVPKVHPKRHRQSKTMSLRELRRELAREPALEPELRAALEAERPRVRAECVDGPRPCPWVSCRHHLALEVTPGGGLMEVLQLEPGVQSCSLDVAEDGGHTLEGVADLLRVTRERVRQIEAVALSKLKHRRFER